MKTDTYLLIALLVTQAVTLGLILEQRVKRSKRAKVAMRAADKPQSFDMDKMIGAIEMIGSIVTLVIGAIQGQPAPRPEPVAREPEPFDRDKWVAAVEASGRTVVTDDQGNDIVMNADGTPCRSCDKARAEAWKARTSNGKTPATSGRASPFDDPAIAPLTRSEAPGPRATTFPEKVVETSGSVVGLSANAEKKA